MNANIWGLLGPEARHQALYSGLLNLGGGLIAAGAPTTQPGMSARGLIAGTQGFNDAINDRQRTGLQGLLVGKQLEEAKRLSDQRALQAKFISTLPPEQQGIAQAAPEQFFGQMANRTFPDPTKARRTLSQQEVKALGLPDGTLAQSDGAGGVHIINKPGLLPPDEEAQRVRIAGAGSTRVSNSLNTGSDVQFGQVPPGWVARRMPDNTVRMEPVPGGPVATSQGAAAAAQRASADIVTQDVGRALSIIDDKTLILPTTGLGGALLQATPGTKAHDLKNLLDTIGGNIAVDKLQEMRAASPTGGALGNVTERELALLQATKGALVQSQSRDQLRENLIRYHDALLDVVHGQGQGPKRLGGGERPDPLGLRRK